MNLKGAICIAVFFIGRIICGFSQENPIHFESVEGAQGKSLDKIVAISQDPNGYMWFASQGESFSVYRYDGSRFVGFKQSNTDTNSVGGRIETLYADRKGMIWIGLQETGLDQYNPAAGVFRHFRHNDLDSGSIGSNIVSAITMDRKGNLWVGTEKGLDKLDERTGKFTHFRYDPADPQSLSSNDVRAVYEDHSGVIWVGTGFPFTKDSTDNIGGLNQLKPDGHFIRYLHDPKNPHSLINNKVRSIFEDSHGTLYVGTAGNGLHTMNRERGDFERHLFDATKPNQLSRTRPHPGQWVDHITFIGEDSSGKIWIGTYLGGLSRYDPATGKNSTFMNGNGFPDSTCWAGYVSRDGVLWIATELSMKLFRADLSAKAVPLIQPGWVAKYFSEDDNGHIWVASDTRGLLEFDQNKNLVHQYGYGKSNPATLMSKELTTIFQNRKDTIWLGTKDGIQLFNPLTQQFSIFSLQGLQADSNETHIIKIMADRNGDIWIAIFGKGLCLYSPRDRSLRQFLPVPGDSSSIGFNLTTTVLEDKLGNIWSGGVDDHAGIALFNRQTGKFKRYMPGLIVVHMYEDAEGDLWVGTNRTLYRYNKQEDNFDPFLEDHPEAGSENVFGMVEDNEKNLWLTRISSIVKINPARTDLHIYGQKSGVPPYSAVVQSICKTRSGRILIGNNNGYFDFAPGELEERVRPIHVLFTELMVNNHPVKPGKGSIIHEPVEQLSELELDNDQNSFSISFAMDDYRSPESNKFLYTLENYDFGWREVNGEQTASYFNVSPGKYIFRLKAVTGNGIRTERTITIRVNPPWWQTWWAYVSYALLLGFVVIGVYRIQKKRIIFAERQKTQLLELAQAKEIEKAYKELKATQAQLVQSEKMASLGELTAGIAHEIQNPLNFVNNFSEINDELIDELAMALDSGQTDIAKGIMMNLKENEQKIIFHGKRADSIVKGMLQHSRTNVGQKEPIDINAMADEYLRLAYHGLRAKEKMFNATLHSDFDDRIKKVNIIPQDMGRVLLNLYNNAFYSISAKNAREKEIAGSTYEPAVWVTTKKTNNYIEISVKDNGSGIPQKVLDKIFQPFFTTKPSGQGTGLGLSLAYDIITKSHGAELKVNTVEGEFAEFIIRLPLS